MKKKILSLVTTTILCSAINTTPTLASEGLFDFTDKERWQIRMRSIYMKPVVDSTTSINGSVNASDDTVPEIDFTYFFTKNVAAELILASTENNMDAEATNSGNLDLGDTRLLPPTLTLQYHMAPESTIRPYVGAGVNYTVFYNEKVGKDINSIKYSDNFGYAVQAGLDYMLDENVGINLDVKRLYLETDVLINDGAVTADVKLDPWIIGAGFTYKF